MTEAEPTGPRLLGSLRAEGGAGVVLMQDRVDAAVGAVWSALTEPAALAAWYGEVSGDLRPGGTYQARLHASGWQGTGRVVACEPRRRLLVAVRHERGAEGLIEVTLAADAGQTLVAWEERGIPLSMLAAYGAGVQVHVEDLGAYLAGRDRGDAQARWAQLHPRYEQLAASRALADSQEPAAGEPEEPAASEQPASEPESPAAPAQQPASARAAAEPGDAVLLEFLAAQRGAVLAILDGLDEQAWHKPVVPTGWTPAGLAEHLAGAEFHWCQQVVAGAGIPDNADSEPYDPTAAFVSSQSPAQVIAGYREACARSDEVLAATGLSAAPRGRHGDPGFPEPPDVRWVVLHLIEETARHAGHLDIARELLDGATGLGPR